MIRPLVSATVLAAACHSAAPSGDSPDAVAAVLDTAAALDAGAGADATLGTCADRDPAKRAYFGDLHTHTSFSIDSYGAANRNDPSTAYRFARGEPVTIAAGEGGTQTTQLDRPLDFAAVTDHAEFLSVIGTCELGAPPGERDCATYHAQGTAQQAAMIGTYLARLTAQDPPPLPGCVTAGSAGACLTAEKTAWQALRDAAAAANAPCQFTSLVAYEWTGTTLGDNLHRNVVFASDGVPDEPYDYLQVPTPKALWQALDTGCLASAGCKALTIPHNSNYSGGRMWDDVDDDAVTRELMARYQTLVEIYQHKAASECMPGSALADADCVFERNGDTDLDHAAGYVRDGLSRGLQLLASGGTNPIQLGFVGATDDHNGAPGSVAEDAWRGHLANTDDTPAERLAMSAFSPGGITAVWAPENTRAEIFAALARRETYATSGPRMAVRTYAVPGVTSAAAAQALCDDPAFPQRLLAAGAVPMGGELHTATAPYLFVAGTADRTPLASFDLVRLRVDAAGAPGVRVRPQALTGNQRQSFCGFWRDPDFQPGVPALYYARVFEQPTPRWSSYDCAAAPNTEGCTDGTIPQTIRERAWTSPIYVLP